MPCPTTTARLGMDRRRPASPRRGNRSPRCRRHRSANLAGRCSALAALAPSFAGECAPVDALAAELVLFAALRLFVACLAASAEPWLRPASRPVYRLGEEARG
jgi:hypothetical protein